MTEDNPYSLQITSDAEDDLKHLDREVAKRIVNKLRWLAANATAVSHTALTGQWTGLYRWRIGDYRAIYALDHEDGVITVIVVGHRRDIYDE
jgi:mRNA interferase RelE/StbE